MTDIKLTKTKIDRTRDRLGKPISKDGENVQGNNSDTLCDKHRQCMQITVVSVKSSRTARILL